MGTLFEELDYRVTPMGPLSLRRRRNISSGEDVYEIILGEEYLMSSRFTAAEEALARIGLARCPPGPIDVVVGGLGLGYTARAALEDRRVQSLTVIDNMPEVVEWHLTGVLPLGKELAGDTRCRFVVGDFFALATSSPGFDAERPGMRAGAVLVDIDHSPTKLLHESHGGFYELDGLKALRQHLEEGGVFALWSTDPPDPQFVALLERVFTRVRADAVEFPDLAGSSMASNTIYSAVAG